jgi:hypothetical protein
MQFALQEKQDGQVIPVLLPGGDKDKVPEFLRLLTWVDLRENDAHELDRLIAAIKNETTPPRSTSFQWLIDRLGEDNSESPVVDVLNRRCAVQPGIEFDIPSDFENRVVGTLKTADKTWAEADLIKSHQIRQRSKLKEFIVDVAMDALLAVFACVRLTSVVREAALDLAKGVLLAILGEMKFTLAEDKPGFADYLNELYVAVRDGDEDQLVLLKKELLMKWVR